jgi:2-keto-4-pentenoate hydratase/2-oxohepta-3-ene-1,7-dioic acid hydratase in catechol pathway
MKLVTYSKDAAISCGILSDNTIIDIPSAKQLKNPPRNMLEILERGPGFLNVLQKMLQSKKDSPIKIPLSSVKLLAPIPRPGKVLALAGNFSEHIQEASIKRGFKLGLSDSSRQTTVPRPFLKPSTSVIGPDEQIPWPDYSDKIDYEIELGVVIGKKIKCADPNESPAAIAGCTIVNDVSARSATFKEGRTQRPWDEFYDWLNGKWADGFLPMGPYLLTADEIEDVQNLNMELKVNGQTRQKANTSQMIYTVCDIVSFLSHVMTLEPGDIIATGTPAGVAVATGNFLKAGDSIECTIEKLGTLTNSLGPKPQKFYTPFAGLEPKSPV